MLDSEILSALLRASSQEKLDEISLRSPKEFDEVKRAAESYTAGMKWIPNSGPQTLAYRHPAELLLYGGQGGGGKSDLMLGLAFTAHRRSLLMRRQYTDLGGMTERAIEINGSRNGYNGSPPPKLRTDDGRLIEFGAALHSGDEQSWQGRPHDLLGVDEATQFLESQIRYLLGWLRTTDPNQRVRAVLGTNPPLDARGDWIIGMFRPWLDITHANPAKPGELRWFVTSPDGKDMEVDGPEPVQLPGAKDVSRPTSRSFIPAALKDNPYLLDTGYQQKLDNLLEPLRSAVRDGNFMAARADDAYQVIPIQWIIEAQQRWKPDGFQGVTMTAAGLDPAAGGDETALACRHGGWFAPLQTVTGDIARDPAHAAGLVVAHRKDNCPVIVDVGGGYGGPTLLLFKENGWDAVRFDGGSSSTARSRAGDYTFYNKRAEAWWKMREELDPSQQGGSAIALPPDPRLLSDLAAPRFEMTTRGIKVESKDDIKDRIGRSPDRGDAVVMCLSEGSLAVARRLGGTLNGREPKVIMSRYAQNRARKR